MLNSCGIAEDDPTNPDVFVDPRELDGLEPSPPTPLGRAQTFCELGRFAEAVPTVAAIITEEPRNVEAWCLMAQAQLGNERPGAALEAARAAASLDPAREQPLRLLSVALSDLGRDEEAAEAALGATQREPESWQAHVRLAHALAVFRNRLGDARRAAERALALKPDDPGPHMALGTVALAAGLRADAAAAFCAALAVDPLCGEAHNQLAGVEAMGPRRGLRPMWSRLLRRSSRQGPAAEAADAF
jgi:predicted Zn-dependent protease